MRYMLVGLVLAAMGGCDFIGGADTLVRGSDNLIVAEGSSDAVAKALSEFETIPLVTDEELAALYATIHEAAMAGDLEAIGVVLRLAAIQRAPEEQDEDE
jgi:hypothetical protein